MKIIILYHFVSMSSSPTSHTFFHVYLVSRFLLVNLSKFGAGMLIKCCILPSKNMKSAKASEAPPGPPLGELTALPPNTLAGFKPILCLVVFFIGPNCMRISLFLSLLNEDLHPSDKK